MAKVSIIICAYNEEEYLRRCLDCVVNQTLKDLEIICVDDGSTDSSLEILKAYASRDKRIVILTQYNQGLSHARTYGINNATGEYIGFIDCDDFIEKDYFELLYRNAIKHNADISMTDNVLIYDNKVIRKKYCGVCSKDKIITAKEKRAKIIVATGISWNKIYRKSYIDRYNLRQLGCSPGSDNFFNAVTIIRANKISVIHEPKYYYVHRKTSLVNKPKGRTDFAVFDNYRYIDEWIDAQGDFSFNEKCYWKYINSKRKKLDFSNFYKTMDKSCREDLKLIANENIKIDNLIVSLISNPEKINNVNKTIESILNQTIKAKRCILWLADMQFPNKEKDLPQELILLKDKGLQFEWFYQEQDIENVLKKYPDSIIITVKDNIIYENDMLEKLYVKYLNTHGVSFPTQTFLILKEVTRTCKDVLKQIINFTYSNINTCLVKLKK